jgi:hypothetical protein
MQVPMSMAAEEGVPPDVSEPIRCALFAGPSRARKHQNQLLQYGVLVFAWLAVVLLIAIAVYYTRGNSLVIRHISSLAPHSMEMDPRAT